jgi:hypothetical protein
MYSLDDLNVTKSCDTPFEFEVTDDQTGKGTGIFLSVIGGHAQRILDFIQTTMNERRTADAMAEKRDPRGKQIHIVPIEDDIAYSTALVAMRVVGWRGIKDPYTPEGAVKLCTINPPIKEQILAKSENLANFPIAVPTP